jgi:hypothetical protein
MSYVPTAKHDVFIAYPIEIWKWAENFEHDLREKLEQSLPPSELAIHSARRGWFLGGASADTEEEAEQSVRFVAVLARGLLSSHGAQIFRREWDAFKRSREIFGLVQTRFVPVLVEEIDSRCIKELFGVVDDETAFQSCFQFHFKDEAGIAQTLVRGTQKGVYDKIITEVAEHVSVQLSRLKWLVLHSTGN